MKSCQPPGNEALIQDDEIDLIRILDVFFDYRWAILRIALVCIALATAFAILFPPRYQADISVQVDAGNGVASAQGLLGDMSSLFDYNSPTSAEQQIMASRLVVTSVVDELHSYIVVRPSRFPLVGDFISRSNDTVMAPGILGFGGWAWGNERADVVQFDVPKRLEGDTFTLTVLSDGRYRLSGRNLDHAVMGRVGTQEQFPTSSGALTLLVRSLDAQPGTKFKLVRQSRFDAISDMQNALTIQEKIKSSGVLIATLSGRDPVAVRDQLQAIGGFYIKQNIERKAADAAQSLKFLNSQMPVLKKQLEDAQAAYTQMRNKDGLVDFPEEAKIALQQTAQSRLQMLELRQKRDELASRFTGSHPEVIALDAKIATLRIQQVAFDQQVKRLPDTQQEAMRLMLDVKVSTDLYATLLNNVQQLKLVKAGKIGNVRVVDAAVIPEDVAFPQRSIVIGAGALLGLLLGVIYAFVHNFLFSGITERDDIENHAGLHVYATIPVSRRQQQLDQDFSKDAAAVRLLAEDNPREPAVESLRSLRTSLNFAMLNATNNLILISGPTPGVGKSFVSANLAALLATGGKRVLVIDADLRKGHLHQYFGTNRERGLSDVIAGSRSLHEVTHRDVVTGLDFISTGVLPPNAAEFLMHGRMAQVLATSSHNYDLVIVDSAPVLAVADAAILAEHCATVLLVARAGLTRVGELVESVKHFAHAPGDVTGALLNGMNPASGRRYGRRNGSYRYVQYGYEESTPARVSCWRRLMDRLGRVR